MLGHARQPANTPRELPLLLGLIGLAALPHFLWLPLWVPLGCAAVWLGVLLTIRGALPKPGRWTRLGLLGAFSTAVLLAFGGSLGHEAGTAMLALLLSLKLLEVESQRDKVVTLFLGLFLLFAAALGSQSLLTGLYLLAGFWMFAAGLMVIADPDRPFRSSLRTSGLLLGQALPLALVLFLLFPRLSSGFLGLSRDQGSAISGLSRTMAPGSITSLARSDAVAFRVSFQGESPEQEALYWRAVVLRRFDGRRWTEGRPCASGRSELAGPNTTTAYTVTLEPTHNQLLVALDLPLASPEGSRLAPGLVLRARRPVDRTRRYTLRSAPRARIAAPARETLAPCLETRPGSNPKTRALVARLAAASSRDREVLESILGFFRSREFTYTLSPPRLERPHPIDDFLFSTKQGYCEHYAQATAWMLRAAGVPARIVAGYQGGERNPVGGYTIVRQAHAHAWVEAQLNGQGWVRVDPTRSIDPERIDPGLAGRIAGASGAASSEPGALAWLGRLRHQTALAWDGLNHAWDSWVLGYSQGRQNALLRRIGLGSDIEEALDAVILAGLLAVLGFLACLALILLRPSRRSLTPAQAAYARFLKKLRSSGLERRPDEGPLAFAERIARLRPELRAEVEAVTEPYLRLRYREEGSPSLLKELRREVRRFKPPRARRGARRASLQTSPESC